MRVDEIEGKIKELRERELNIGDKSRIRSQEFKKQSDLFTQYPKFLAS